MEVSKHPIDFDALKKGDLIPPEVLVRAYGFTPDTARYRYDAQLRLRDAIEEVRRDLCVKCEGDALRILTDEENSDYQDRRVRGGVGTIRRSFVRQCRTDEGNLSDESRQKHASRLAFNGMTLQAIEEVPKRMTTTMPQSLPAMR